MRTLVYILLAKGRAVQWRQQIMHAVNPIGGGGGGGGEGISAHLVVCLSFVTLLITTCP